MNDLVPKVGVWRSIAALGSYKLKDLLWPEGLPAVIVGAGGAIALLGASELSSRIALMNNVIQLSAALLAVVFTALAIMVALPAGSYLRALQQDDPHSNGMQGFLSPFLVAVGTQIAILILALGYGPVAEHLSRNAEHVVFCVLGFLVIYGLLDVAALARSLVRHGIFRARDAVREAEETENVHALPERRSG
jgi:small-conductance mechanosensitive channel